MGMNGTGDYFDPLKSSSSAMNFQMIRLAESQSAANKFIEAMTKALNGNL